MDFGARVGRYNKWMMMFVYPFYLFLVSDAKRITETTFPRKD